MSSCDVLYFELAGSFLAIPSSLPCRHYVAVRLWTALLALQLDSASKQVTKLELPWLLDSMRLPAALRSHILLLAAFLLGALQASALEDVQAPLEAVSQQDSTGNNQHGGIPKLFKPKTGIMKEEHDVDPGNQRARADEVILENAEEYQPETERVIDSLEDLS
jgi:hypothetical protein